MRKLNTLRVDQLNLLLRAQNVTVIGNKAAKIAKLIELLGTDEVDESELEADAMQLVMQQFGTFTQTLENLSQTVATLTVENRATSDKVAQLMNNAAREQPPIMPAESMQSVAEIRVENVRQAPTISAGHQWSIKDVKGLIPEFDPLKKIISPQQFIDKAEMLRRAYGWNEEVLLVSVQHQLKGAAKNWCDAQQVFLSWQDFVNAFIRDFPAKVSSAEYHKRLMKQRKKSNQTLIEFYYETLAIGRRGQIDDESIVTYIIEGVNDPSLVKSLLAQNIKTCNELLGALENISESSIYKLTHEPNPFRPKYTGSQDKQQSSEQVNGPRCYNCQKRGHIAAKCPQPQQQKVKCERCQTPGHEAKNCYVKVKPNVTSVQSIEETMGIVPPLFKTICINNLQYQGFVDTGSSHSLIEETEVPESVERKQTNVLLKGFGGTCVESQEAFTAEVMLDGEKFNATFYIIPEGMSPYPILLGRNILCRTAHSITICVDAVTVRDNKNQLIMNVEAQEGNGKFNFDINHDLSVVQTHALKQLLIKYETCFAEDIIDLGKSKSSKMKIEVTTDEPIVGKRYQIPFSQRGILSTILEKLINHGIIRPSNAKHAASVVLVKKANGENRMCVDYRALNAVTKKKHYPMPVVEEQLAKLSGNTYFSTLDMTAGYYQIAMEEDSKGYTAFATHEGLFEHNVMPFGLVNAPMQFQEMVVSNIINKLQYKQHVISYVDEVIIATPNVEMGLTVLKEVLEAVKIEGLTLRPSKCTFMQTMVKFLGHKISYTGIQPGEEKTECIKTFPIPTNVSEVRQFLGLTGFFRKFVNNYAQKTESLTQLLKKNSSFKWGDKQQQAFELLKSDLVKEPILALYDCSKPHEVHTDASIIGLSGMLLQNDENGWRVVFYYSRQCTEAEKKYSSHELEVLAIVESLERFRLYLLGSEFVVVTDCNSVVTTKAITPLPARIARWWLKLQEFSFKMIHRPGREMAHVDGMSRMPTLPPQEATTVAEHILSISPSEPEDWIFAMQLQDHDIRDIVHALEENSGENMKQLYTDYVIVKKRLYRKIDGVNKLVVPKTIRWRIVKSCHDDCGHFGLEKTIARITQNFWFPRIRRYVKSYIDSCPECCYNKVKGGKAEGQLHISDAEPIPFRSIHLDHIGPFIKSKKCNQYVIVLVCSFSKFVIMRAVRNTKTTPVLQFLRDNMAFFGQPQQIITDRGTAFTSNEFESYMKKLGINHIKTAVRTPRANGQVERVNRTLLASLKCSTNNVKEWDMQLNQIQWSINSQQNSTTKFSPNQLVFNFQLKNLSENRIIQALHEPEPIDLNEYRNMKEIAAKNINKQQIKWKTRFDNKHCKPKIYDVGDLVVIDYVSSATGLSHKLDPQYKGPYIVTKILGSDRYVVEDLPYMQHTQKKYTGVLSSDRMKPWCQNDQELYDDDYESGEAEL